MEDNNMAVNWSDSRIVIAAIHGKKWEERYFSRRHFNDWNWPVYMKWDPRVEK